MHSNLLRKGNKILFNHKDRSSVLSVRTFGTSACFRSSARILKLDSGLLVASDVPVTTGPVGMCVLLRAGSRYCQNFPIGITHVIKRMAFTSTNNFFSQSALSERVSAINGVVDCQVDRTWIMYALLCGEKHIDLAIELLADACLRPIYQPNSLEKAKSGVLAELEREIYAPEPEQSFTGLRYQAAYGKCQLGFPELATQASLETIDTDSLYSHHSHFYKPPFTTFAAITDRHDEVIASLKKHFKFGDTTWQGGKNNNFLAELSPEYIGGTAISCADKPRVQPGHAEFPELAHVGVGFNCVPEGHRSIWTAYVIQGLLGSGRSFSSGGPGKGLYSRLNLNVLCRYGWVNSCIAEVAAHKDAGIFYIYGSCEPKRVSKFIDVILEQYYSVINDPISELELQRAKRQVLSLALGELEHLSVRLEALGRNVASQQRSLPLSDIIEKIESVSVEHVKSFCAFMLNSPPSVAALGMVSALPSYDRIKSAVSKNGFVSSFRW